MFSDSNIIKQIINNRVVQKITKYLGIKQHTLR